MSDKKENDILGSQRAYSQLSSRINRAPLWIPHRDLSPSLPQTPAQPGEQRSASARRSSSRSGSKERPSVRFADAETHYEERTSRRSAEMYSSTVVKEKILPTHHSPRSSFSSAFEKLHNSAPRKSVLYPDLSEAILNTPVRLHRTNKEREHFDNLSDLYAIVNSIEQLEKAHQRNYISTDEYTPACHKLLFQYNEASSLIQREQLADIGELLKKYRFECPKALERIKENSPLKMDARKASNQHKNIADIVATYITVMDKLRLGLTAVDEIQPEMRELLDTMNLLGTTLPDEFEGKIKVVKWLARMDKMGASDRFDELDVRQMLFDYQTLIWILGSIHSERF